MEAETATNRNEFTNVLATRKISTSSYLEIHQDTDVEPTEVDVVAPPTTTDDDDEPEEQEDTTDTTPATKPVTPTQSPVVVRKSKFAVFSVLKGKEFKIECPKGSDSITSEVLDIALETMTLPAEANDAFALWMVSPSLQIELKPHHLPFKILKSWPDLLETYTNSNPAKEIPMMYFKRKEMFHLGLEREQDDGKITRLLFDEAIFSMIYGFYPCSVEEATHLAALALQIEVASVPEKAAMKNKSDILDIQGCYIPTHLVKKISKRKWVAGVWAQLHLLGDVHSDVVEERKRGLGSCAFDRDGLERICNAEPFLERHEMRKEYLSHMQSWPWYAATFFYGYLEPPPKKMTLKERPDILVRVGVNLDGIHVIRDDLNEVVLSLPFHQLQYNSYVEESEQMFGRSEKDTSSFVIEYDLSKTTRLFPLDEMAKERAFLTSVSTNQSDAEGNETSVFQLVVWSPQASMIDTLVSKYVMEIDSQQALLKSRGNDWKRTGSIKSKQDSSQGQKNRIGGGWKAALTLRPSFKKTITK